MEYRQVVPARFLERPNRFVAWVEVEGRREVAHVKNTGRCRELLLPGTRVFLAPSENPLRKTRYDLVSLEKERPGRAPLMVNVDSQAPNQVAAEWLPSSGLFGGGARFRREVTCGASRFDFQIQEGEKTTFLEVKGVTLEEEGVAMFPDAPTLRGARHLRELAALRKSGHGACVLFVVQMEGMEEVRPHDRRDPAFGDALREAAAAGVRLLAVECRVTPASLQATRLLPVRLDSR
ncbi:MAG: DNA/RNA nuclease SfsA [Oligosphaeraceae bacterium]